MTYKFEDLNSFFTADPAIEAFKKTATTARTVVEGASREQLAAAGELLELSLQQFEAVSEAQGFNAVLAANQAWLSGSVDILSSHSAATLKIFQDAFGAFDVTTKADAEAA